VGSPLLICDVGWSVLIAVGLVERPAVESISSVQGISSTGGCSCGSVGQQLLISI
jgi:hypothetical protein